MGFFLKPSWLLSPVIVIGLDKPVSINAFHFTIIDICADQQMDVTARDPILLCVDPDQWSRFHNHWLWVCHTEILLSFLIHHVPS